MEKEHKKHKHEHNNQERHEEKKCNCEKTCACQDEKCECKHDKVEERQTEEIEKLRNQLTEILNEKQIAELAESESLEEVQNFLRGHKDYAKFVDKYPIEQALDANLAESYDLLARIAHGDLKPTFDLMLDQWDIKNIKSVLDEGVTNSFRPLLNSSAIVGYGSVIKSLAIFSVVQNFVFNISSNPIISEALSVNLICGLTASASGGLTITLDALAPTYLQMASALNISPEILHRVASLACGGLDTLPHNGAVITTLAICGLTHKESYKDIFVTSVLIPIIVTAIIVIGVSIYI